MSGSRNRKHLSLIRPPLDVPDVASFSYPGLHRAVLENYPEQFEAADEVFSRYDSDDEEALDLRLSHEYLLISALKLQDAVTDEERRLWSQRYTAASIENYGQPDLSVAAMIAADDLPVLTDAVSDSSLPAKSIDRLLSAYNRLAESYDPSASKLDYQGVIDQVGDYLIERFPAVRQALSGEDDQVLNFIEINRRFIKALELLDWEGWSVESNRTAQMSVSPQTKKIFIGKYIPNLTLRRVRALFAHEALTHAQRAVNGGRIDINLSYGLPGYLASEEGLGVVLESAVESKLPSRVGDRYVDIALALGLSGDGPLTRFELFSLTMTRMLLRLGPAAESVNRNTMRRIAWQHVNRIYRGSLGNEFVGVFTRDISYYEGFRKMIEYLSRYQDADFDDALDFALSGKFDPTNPKHRLYVHKRQFGIETDMGDLEI